jgi:hypothetical protein
VREAVIDAWKPRLLEGVTDPAPFFLEYKVGIEQLRNPCDIDDIIGADIKEFAKARPSSKQGGLDAWRTKEFKKLPACILELLATMYFVIESRGKNWPEVLCCAPVGLLHNGEGNLPLKQRPITVMSIPYLANTSLRYSRAKVWQAKTFPGSLFGGTAGLSTSDAEVNDSIIRQQELLDTLICLDDDVRVGVFAESVSVFEDRAKCFDSIKAQLNSPALEALGCSPKLVGALVRFYESHVRMFRIQQTVGPKFSTQSMAQGDDASLIAVNGLFSVLVQRLKNTAPRINPKMHIDDCKMTGHKHDTEQFRIANRESRLFDKLAGQKLNITKCKMLAVGDSDLSDIVAAIDFQGEIMDFTKSLGYGLHGTTKINRSLQDSRVEKALPYADKLATLPRNKELRLRVVGAGLYPRITYGAEIMLPSDKILGRLRTMILFAAFSAKRAIREPQLVLTLLTKVHRTDPKSAVVFTTLCKLRKAFSDPLIRNVAENVWEELKGRMAPGPLFAMKECVVHLRWAETDCPWAFARQRDVDFEFLAWNKSLFDHELRRSIRWQCTAQVPSAVTSLDCLATILTCATPRCCSEVLSLGVIGNCLVILSCRMVVNPQRASEVQLALS